MTRLAAALLMIVAAASIGCGSAVPAPAAPPAPIAPTPSPAPSAPAIAPVATTMPVVPLDLPKASAWTGERLIFVVDLALDGTTFVNGEKLTSDDELLVKARLTLREHPEVSAVIRADQRVTYGRVIRALDLLKQAGIAKIAFGVEAIAAPPKGPAPGTP